MELKEYGPLAQNKMTTENNKTSWVPLVVMLGLGVVISFAWVNINNQHWQNIYQGSKGLQ